MNSPLNVQKPGQRVQMQNPASKQAVSQAQSNFASTMMATTARVLNTGAGAKLAQPFVPGQSVLSAAVTRMGAQKSAGADAARAAASTMIAMGGTGMKKKSAATASSVDDLVDAGDPAAILMQETKEMQELNMQFNMQFLMLQHHMEGENRQFTTLSNVMKTKHETA
ncbi:MAG: hypothetical protein AAFQ82_00350, partial [Myxococcota bacterium]